MKDLILRDARSVGVAARLVTAAITTCALYYGRVILIPLALALLVAFALHPVVRRLVAWRIPRTLSVAVVISSLMATLGGLGWFIGGQLTAFGNELPRYRENIVEKLRDAREIMSGGVIDKVKNTVTDASEQAGVTATAVSSPDQPSAAKSTSSGLGGWLESIGAVTDPLTTFGLVILLAAMMLLQWPDLRSRFLAFLSGNVLRTTNALADASARVGHFLFLQFIYNSTFGILIGLALWTLGVPYPALWGLCAALFRYVPYAGPLIAAMLPLAVSLVTSTGWTQVLTVGAVFLVLELISNNFVEPWLYGSKLGVSEIGIVMASVAWTYLWGPAGLLLATPLTVCLVVLGKHVRCLGFLSKLLGNDDVLSDSERYYQRMLAGDSLEAIEQAGKLIKDRGSSHFLNDTLLPALARARRDQAEGWLTDENTEELSAQIDAVSDLLAADRPSDEGKEPSGPHDAVVLWSVCPLTDAILPLLEREMRLNNLMNIKSSELTGSAIKQLVGDDRRPRAISVLYLSDVDTARAIALVKRLRQHLPEVPVQLSRLGEDPLSATEKNDIVGAQSCSSNINETRAWTLAFAS